EGEFIELVFRRQRSCSIRAIGILEDQDQGFDVSSSAARKPPSFIEFFCHISGDLRQVKIGPGSSNFAIRRRGQRGASERKNQQIEDRNEQEFGSGFHAHLPNACLKGSRFKLFFLLMWAALQPHRIRRELAEDSLRQAKFFFARFAPARQGGGIICQV